MCARQVFFEDIELEVRQEARTAFGGFSRPALSGVDLLLSTYGPALSVISRHWPVYSSTAAEDGSAQLLRPEEALNAARAEVVRMQRSRLIGHPANLDTLTDFALIAWDTFRASEFPFDEARRLALAVGGLDMAELERAEDPRSQVWHCPTVAAQGAHPPGRKRAGGSAADRGAIHSCDRRRPHGHVCGRA